MRIKKFIYLLLAQLLFHIIQFIFNISIRHLLIQFVISENSVTVLTDEIYYSKSMRKRRRELFWEIYSYAS